MVSYIKLTGPARWYMIDPEDYNNGVSIGDITNFKVWVIARPLPRQDQWYWKFSPSNSSNVMTTNPGHVHLTVSDDMAVLSITNVTISYYGNYYIWTNNQYGGWNEDELMFILKPQGKLILFNNIFQYKYFQKILPSLSPLIFD